MKETMWKHVELMAAGVMAILAVVILLVIVPVQAKAQSLEDGAWNGQLYLYLQERSVLYRVDIELQSRERPLVHDIWLSCSTIADKDVEKCNEIELKVEALQSERFKVLDRIDELTLLIQEVTTKISEKRRLSP